MLGDCADLRVFLQKWRSGDSGNVGSKIKPRSFRPNYIVPRLYLGAIKDVQDIPLLNGRLVPEKLLLMVSTCEPTNEPRLEFRHVLPATVKGEVAEACKMKVSSRVRRLAVCAWEELEACLNRLSREGPSLMEGMARWLKLFFQSATKSMAGTGTGGADLGRSQIPKESNEGVLYMKLCLPWKDEPTFAVRQYFPLAVSLMQCTMDELQGAVVCYCAAGKSRSATLVCAFLLHYYCKECAAGNKSCSATSAVSTVLEFVREARLCVGPNEGFVQQLREYANDLFATPP
ncbi:Dual specificity phosphatase catalytic domain [Trypanosoma vivax]|uniref:Tyrosine specific protein phosphatases domain-containing protein n=1 Tax=Trypanosoma vivax (strain Y486) TaxID=1055687 RepID=G0U8E1_TRYVY|nr:hypothetical protein TRVL_08491 [Trypanosoma vivax]KAH8605159.1 Dual specificity phosphatase catalytic domain [Trypanosoma vivax]CCC53865.1 conserved hypothetical protein [Trypanosoma vivax Y486]